MLFMSGQVAAMPFNEQLINITFFLEGMMIVGKEKDEIMMKIAIYTCIAPYT